MTVFINDLFQVDKHRELDSDQQSDSGESRESGDGSSASSGDEDDDEDDEELDKEEEELNRRAQMTTEELMAVARARAAEGEGVVDLLKYEVYHQVQQVAELKNGTKVQKCVALALATPVTTQMRL